MFGPLSTLATDYDGGKESIEELYPLSSQLCVFSRGEINILRRSLLFSLDGIKIIIFINYKQLSLYGVLRVNSLVNCLPLSSPFYSSTSSSSSTSTRFCGRDGRRLGAFVPLALTVFGVVGGNSKSRNCSSVRRSL